MSLLDSETIEIACPECGQEHSQTIGWMKTNDTIACSCGTTIKLDKDQLVRDVGELEKALDAALPKGDVKITIRL